ncbi:hypothetical protein CPC08DRAFT_681028 [Agrocybe pediades]|nr:hypothetical protein CPC08DRAFT_681028 [Agrocybe pediades]
MEAFMHGLGPATNLGVSPNRNNHTHVPNGSQQCAPESPEEKLQRHLEEYNKTVTIIIWYKSNMQPIRLHQTIPAFPYFRLSAVRNLIENLGLSDDSYLDTYNPSTNQWEQHMIHTVRLVDTQQRLLYKVRRSLIDGLSDDECETLREELQLQPRGNMNISSPTSISQAPNPNKNLVSQPLKAINDVQAKTAQKRPAPQAEDQDSQHSPKIHVSTNYYTTHSGTHAIGSNAVPGPSTNTSSPSLSNNNNNPQGGQHQDQQQQDGNVYMYQSPVFYGSSPNAGTSDTDPGLPPYLLTPQATQPPIPYHPHPPLKRWPNDYTVSELSNGFRAMDLLISQSPTGSSMTQRTAFERVFGSRYVKSTVCRHRAVWRKAPRMLREQFEAMGTDDRACWGEFVRRVENRPPGKNANTNIDSSMMASPQNANMGYHDQHNHTAPDDEEIHNQEVMGALQNQVPSAPNNTMQNNMAVYDPSRNHLPNGGHNG